MANKFGYTYDHYFDFSESKYFGEMNDVFSGIFDRSVNYYLSRPDGYPQQFALRKLVEYVRDLEKSLIGLIDLGYVTRDNLELVKNAYKGLDTIGLLKSCYQGRIYGLSAGKRIEINPNLSGSKTLTSEERTLLYVCHEMGHKFHEGWTNVNNLNYIMAEPQIKDAHQKLSKDSQSFIYSGYSLLDEALTQDRAEAITYYFAGKKRPPLTTRTSRLFNGKPFKSNFDYYRELQEPAIKFGKTLQGISKNDYDTLKTLGRAALDSRFARKIENEYRSRDEILGLFVLIHAMGVIKESTYEVFGMGLGNAIPRSKYALELLEKITSQSQQSTTKKTPDLPKRYQK